MSSCVATTSRAIPDSNLAPAGLERARPGPRSRSRTEIVALRKELADLGLDAGAQTIAVHLARRAGEAHVPSVATIWRILVRRGFVTPQPQKRPRSSFVRFEAEMPNERWQADITHWRLAEGSEVEIFNAIDDHSRLLVASEARVIFKAADVVASFHRAAATHGFCASLLTDNGAVFTAAPRGGRCALELETARLGIRLVHSRPYHPQTCGKVERFHQTLKRFMAKQEPADYDRRAPGPAGSVRRLLQHRAPAPSARTADARRSVLGSAEGRALAGRDRRRPTSAFAGTRSTSAGPSPCATTHGCTTSGSDAR